MKKKFDVLNFANDLKKRCALSNIKKFKKNEVITTYLIKRSQLCILINGEADIVKYLVNGDRRIVFSLLPGDIFGEAIYNVKTSKELLVTAKKDCEVLFLPYDKIENCSRDCFFHLNLLRNLPDLFIRKILTINQRIETMTYKSIRERLLFYFDTLEKKNSTITIPYSYTDLADYLALDRSALMRELNNMQKDCLIKKEGKKITLLYK